MSRVQELQEIEGLASADLAQNQTIRAMTEGCFQEVANRYGGKAVLFAAGFKPNEILLRQLNLGRVFDDEHSFILRNEFSEDRKQSRFSSACSAADQDVLAREDIVFQVVREGAIKSAFANQVFHLEVAGVELANRERHAGEAARRDHRGDAAAIGEARVENGLRFRDVVAQ